MPTYNICQALYKENLESFLGVLSVKTQSLLNNSKYFINGESDKNFLS